MANHPKILAVALILLVSNHATIAQEEPQKNDALDTSTFDSEAGYFNFLWDAKEGRIWLDIDQRQEPFLYVSSLATGLGSNPIGLDRGQLGESRIVHFRRVGKRVYLVQENWNFRASSKNEAERKAIRESFAESILWSGEVRESATGQQLVDLSDFLLRDAHDCIGVLKRSDQGDFSLATDLSHIYMDRTKSFPENTEFEATLTFRSNRPGRLAGSVAADGKSITLRQHHSFVQLPDSNYKPRRFDPRVGCFAMSYADYGVPIDEPIEQHWIVRHRLEKQDSKADKSPAKEPIIYYVDPGAPQPVRDALVEGASWWNAAFEAAGFLDAFQVKILPEDADPMDVRYNMIQWVHRSTRGWSYGQSVTDPRTGEIIKGHVLLGSLRVRQDHLLFDGLTPNYPNASNNNAARMCGMGQLPAPTAIAQLDPNLSSTEVALARIRQLSAHEVGHTLGFAHNFAASTYMDRASVMDYPAPRTKIVDGKLDLSDAYAVGIGEWDKFTVQYAYSQFDQDEESQLDALVADALAKKMLYITDADSRSSGAAHPLSNLWDNGTDPVTQLTHEMEVRKIALSNFGANNLADGLPLADLEKTFVPIYLHHRYQVDATAKMLGGYEYTYAVKGDGQVPQSAIPVARQQAALTELIKTLQPEALVIPQAVLDVLPPRVGSAASDRERFDSSTGPIFDPSTAIRTAVELTLGNILQPQRASRLARHADDNWGLLEVIDALISTTIRSRPPRSALELEARRIVQDVFVDKLIELASSGAATADARAIATWRLREINSQFQRDQGQMSDGIVKAHLLQLSDTIERFLDRPSPEAKSPGPISLPPGSPIGQE